MESDKVLEVGDFASIDLERDARCGHQETIFGEGKSAEQIAEIVRAMHETGRTNILITRVSAEKIDMPGVPVFYDKDGRVAIAWPEDTPGEGDILIITAGTSDMAVAKEAYYTARVMGNRAEIMSDVGVSGIHRLLAREERLRSARVIIVIAGMEGALASVVGGLVSCPVIAVPTSVGYGASFGGVSALLSMLNSCAAGVTVVNIDNGFGAAVAAGMINKAYCRSLK